MSEDHTRWYGLRVGDKVIESAFGCKFSGTVVRLHPTDNNGCTIRFENGYETKAVCEWCTVIEAAPE